MSDEQAGSARRAFAGGQNLDPGPGGGHPGVDGEPTSAAADLPINRVAAALRRIGAVTIGQPLEDEDLGAAGARLAEVAEQLEEAAAASKRKRKTPGQAGFPGVHPQDHFPTSPMIGFANPISPPVEVWAVEGEGGRREIRGRVTFDYPFEGPPTCVHGGVIAELFDELLGLSNILAGNGAMTGTLTVRYRRPTPLLAPLELAARHTGQEGRKVYAWGGLYHEGELTAEAEGVFILVDFGRMLDIVSGNAHGAHSAEGPLVDADWQRMMGERERRKGDAP
ncbi:MAG TPA: PaaI family thioesterase [Acidimicrobiales bacterium]|nr:PaaI family thioesterase [Acidimicrobiales bacterium]